MAVTYGAIGTTGSTTGTTSVTAAYPTGIAAATSKLYLVVTGRSNTASTSAAVTGGGWTLVGAFEGGVGTWGVDAGTRRVEVWRKDSVTGSETGNITVTLAGTTANTLYARIVRVEVPSGYGISEQFVSGADTSAGTAFSATASSNVTFTTDDLLLIAHAGTTDTSTQSAQSITASGITFGTRTNRAGIAVTGGNDHRHVIDTVSVTTGSGTAVAPTYAYTGSASTSGPVGFLVLTEVPPPAITSQPTDATVTEPATGSFSVTATGSITSYQWQTRAPGGGGGPPTFLGVTKIDIASPSPGALSIDVPAGALGVVITIRANYEFLSITSDFAGTFEGLTPIPSNRSVRMAWAPVTATGTGRTISPTFGSYLTEGPVFGVWFFGNIDNSTAAAWLRDYDYGEASPLTVDSSTSDIVAVMDNWSTTTAAIPPNEAGWTSLETEAFGNLGARFRVADSPGASTTTANAQTGAGGSFSGLALMSIMGGAVSPWTDVSTGTGGTTSSYTTAATTTALDGYEYRCVITGPGGVTISSTATLTVNPGGGGSTVTEVTSLAMAVQLAQGATASVGLAVQAPQQVATSVGLAVSAAQSASASLAAAIQQAQAASSLVQLAVQAPQSNSASVAAAVQLARTAAASLDLVIQQAQALGVGVDLQVQTPSAASAAVSLQIQVGSSLSTALAIAVRELRQASAAVALAVSQARTVATDASLAVQVSRSAGVSSTMAVRQARTSAASVDLQIQDGATRATSLQAAVQFAADASVAVSMAVADLRAAGVGLSMAISLQRVLGAVVDLYVREASLAAFGLAIFILDEGFDSESDTVRYQRIARAIERGQAQGSASSVFLKIGKRSRYRGM